MLLTYLNHWVCGFNHIHNPPRGQIPTQKINMYKYKIMSWSSLLWKIFVSFQIMLHSTDAFSHFHKEKIYIWKKLEILNSHINIINVNRFCPWTDHHFSLRKGQDPIGYWYTMTQLLIHLYKLQWRARKLKIFPPFLFPQSISAVFLLHRITLLRDAFGIRVRAWCGQGESHSFLQNSSEVTVVTDVSECSVRQTEKSGKFKCWVHGQGHSLFEEKKLGNLSLSSRRN